MSIAASYAYTAVVVTTRSDDAVVPGSGASMSSVLPASRRVRWGLAAVAAAGCTYVAVVDPNTSSFYPQCPFRALTGLDCPGCGITRALHSALHGDILGAANHNLLVVTLAVLAVLWVAISWVRRRVGASPLQLRSSRAAVLALGAVVLAFWVLRNLPMQPFHWLNSAA